MPRKTVRRMISAALRGKGQDGAALPLRQAQGEGLIQPQEKLLMLSLSKHEVDPAPQHRRRSALGGAFRPGRYGADRPAGPGVIVALRHPVSIVSIIARQGKAAALSETLRAHLGLDCPPPGRSTGNGRLALHWCGFEQWYAVAENFAEGALYEELRDKLSGLAALSDQSHGRVILVVAGPRARDLLAKGTPVDLHPREFGPGRSAVTQMAHVGVHLAQVGPETFELSVFRGFAESFWDWLTEMAAEFGYEVR